MEVDIPRYSEKAPRKALTDKLFLNKIESEKLKTLLKTHSTTSFFP